MYDRQITRWLVLLLTLSFSFKPGLALKLDRVILATDANPMYLEFSPFTAKIWQQVTGLRPTLALIADQSVVIDETLGDVIRFEPLPDIPTSLQAQVIRLLLPAFFPEDGCILSDIDMIPLQKAYFVNNVAGAPDDSLVVYRNRACDDQDRRYPMCYNAAKGRIWAEIFGIHSVPRGPLTAADIATIKANIRQKIQDWASLGHGWHTDELCLTHSIKNWKNYPTNVIKLNHAVKYRIDRSAWHYDIRGLTAGFYIDSHLLRPYSSYHSELNQLSALLKTRSYRDSVLLSGDFNWSWSYSPLLAAIFKLNS